MTGLVVPISILLYLILPAWMLSRGWPIRAGIAMMFAALLPWAVVFATEPPPWEPGAGIALMFTAAMLLLAFVPIAIGIGYAMLRLLRKRHT
jgi:hypothetical protein